MKWLGRVLYILLLLFISNQTVQILDAKMRLDFFEDNAEEYFENYDREKYMEIFFTAMGNNNYLKDPVYVAKTETGNNELSIYHGKYRHKKENLNILYFSFLNTDENLESLLLDKEQYEKNNDSAVIQLDLKFKDVETKSSVTFNINSRHRFPKILIQFDQVDGKDVFKFIIPDDKNQAQEATSTLIEKMEIFLIDGTKMTKKEDEPVKTKLLSIAHDNEATMIEEDVLVSNEGVYEGLNFNGDINNYLLGDNYNEETIGLLHPELFNAYRPSFVKGIVIYSFIAVIVSYLIFFLKPTINYFKNRKPTVAVKSEEILVEAEEVDQIFHDYEEPKQK